MLQAENCNRHLKSLLDKIYSITAKEMYLHHLFTLLFLARSCTAGPLIILIAMATDTLTELGSMAAGAAYGAADYAGDLAAAAVYDSALGQTFGMAASEIWFGNYVIVNGELFYGGSIKAGAAILAAGGAAAGGKLTAVKGAKSSSIMASIVSVAKSDASVEASADAVHTSLMSAASARMSEAATQTDNLPFKFTFSSVPSSLLKPTSPTPSTAITPSSTGIPPPPGTPVGTLPPAQRPTECPPGVPEYNFRMCQYSVIEMGAANESLVIDIPNGSPQSIRVDNIPSTCMVLSQYLVDFKVPGPHAVPMGASSLQWNDVNKDGINLVRNAFGLPNVTSPAASTTGKP